MQARAKQLHSSKIVQFLLTHLKISDQQAKELQVVVYK